MIKELWSLANIVAGFSVAQSVAFAIALGKDLGKLQSQKVLVKIVLTILYCLWHSLLACSISLLWLGHVG